MAEQKTHIRELRDSDYLGIWDLKGKEPTVTISKVYREEVFSPQKNSVEGVVTMEFEGKKKKFILNATGEKRIAKKSGYGYGPYIEDWIGKKITLTTETFRGEEVLRVKNPLGGQSIREMSK